MSKIKSVSQFEDGIWGTETPIGADASNVDVEMSDSSTKDLQTVLGDIPSAAAPIQSQINTKVTASGGNIGNTTVSSGIQNFDSSSSETSTELLDTSVRVTNATEVTSSMWTKFNRFRKRVDNKFKDVFLSSVEDVASPSDYKTYSQSALNDYFANVVGYASASDLPDATSTIAQQLSTLNNNFTDTIRWYSYLPPSGDTTHIFCFGPVFYINKTESPHGILYGGISYSSIACTNQSTHYAGFRSDEIVAYYPPSTFTGAPLIGASVAQASGGFWFNNGTSFDDGYHFFLSSGVSAKKAVGIRLTLMGDLTQTAYDSCVHL